MGLAHPASPHPINIFRQVGLGIMNTLVRLTRIVLTRELASWVYPSGCLIFGFKKKPT